MGKIFTGQSSTENKTITGESVLNERIMAGNSDMDSKFITGRSDTEFDANSERQQGFDYSLDFDL